ncbi:MAG: DUF1579 family protein [Rubricoccaceae bacterium]|nr:DUF1579 family protein [Rubricoccaceae bacterium]
MHSDRFPGRWKGTKELYFEGPPEPDNVSDSEMTVSSVAHGKFLSITYTWTFKDVDHEGFLLIGRLNPGEASSGAWVDSFHMSGKVWPCEGVVGEDGKVDLHGTYEAPPGPDWGWRITLASDGRQLQLLMYNISPEGDELLAVQASYERV